MMRRALAWTAVCLLLAGMAAALCMHVKLPCRMQYRLSASQAASRAHERMPIAWPDGAVDVNTADAEMLDTLPGVGPAIAQRILDERALNGPFLYPEDLVTVSGIGEKTLRKLWDHITLSPLPNEQE